MRSGYMITEVLIAIVMAGVLLSVFTTMNFYGNIQSNILKQQNTKIILEVLRSRLLKLAEDPDVDSYFELLKEDDNGTLPIDIGVGTDGWGKRIYYSTVDLGTSDGTNAPYADTNTSISPNSNIAGRLISSGEDRILDTTLTDTLAQNDDLMLEIGIGELNHFKLYGGSEINGETRAYNSAITSTVAPVTPIHGTIWIDPSANSKQLQFYDATVPGWVVLK